ncbi:Uncharacterised protein [Cardiobacterium hominis]|uniref:Uncharacterized protein n=1 Tax=Cardiobacterium hominis (strain ATCC 15826 / DSM 8339 / NCTC 10426 / 6573) TaxID=638300 RepID=C8N7A7_CARH6|nr:hypothetical protein [Cardiobacterium hominis]EEV89483.1 hypothetical protein HMPREF0198_0384 [Cardiobacterium hominis ATCC 15826]VEG77005.1 Uncharacterised protein [Cardiobacterium hominis]
MLTPQDIFQFLAYAAIATVLAGLFALLITVWTVVYHVSQPGKRLRNNLIATPLALLVAFAWAYIASSDDRARQREMQAKADARQKEYLESKAIFEERCKSAGEKIYQTVENVEGITLLNVPEDSPQSSYNDPMWENAALPWSGTEEEYIKKFLFWEIRYDNNSMIDLQTVDPRPSARETQIRLWGHPTNMSEHEKAYRGYRYADAQQKDKHFLRYRFPDDKDRKDKETLLVQAIERPSRYALEYKPIVDPADRKHWIAGLTVNIYDLQTNTLMATKTWYALNPSQGHAYQTWEWSRLENCPAGEADITYIRYFLNRVIQPKQGD